MVYQRDTAIIERGGIPVRDTTQGGSLAIESTRGGLAKLNFDSVASALGWFSMGLGLMEVLMPRRIQKLVGVRGNHTGLIRILGIREILHTLLIFVQRRPQQGVLSRLVGDAMDLSLVGAAFTSPHTTKSRAVMTTASLLGVTGVDLLTTTQLGRKREEQKRYSVLTQEQLQGRTKGGAFHVMKNITVNASPETLYQFWHNFENLPQFMYHLEKVHVKDAQHSHWVAKAPAGTQVEWDAEITDDRPNELIAWQSTEDADVPNSGQVRFEQAPAGRGTVVHVEIEYRPPGGAIGRVIAKLFGEEPGQQVAGDLHRFKQVIETGEVVRSEGSPEGFGQKAQHPARPMLSHNGDRGTHSAPKRQRKQTARQKS